MEKTITNIECFSENPECDFSQDFPHDNGCYQHTCVLCGKRFHGMKGRVVCKKCLDEQNARHDQFILEKCIAFGKYMRDYPVYYTVAELYDKYVNEPDNKNINDELHL